MTATEPTRKVTYIIPTDILTELEAQAKQHRRSINQEVITILEAALKAPTTR